MTRRKWTCDWCGKAAIWQAIVEVRVPGEGRTVGALGCDPCAKRVGFASAVVSNYVGPRKGKR